MTYYQPWAQGERGPFWQAGVPDAGSGLPGYMYDSSYTGDLLKMELRVRDSW